jgi:hypothetical protein
MPDPYGDPVYDGILDECLGHTGGQGVYHHHALLVKCLTAKSEDLKPSPIVGYALDGFPILGPYECADKACSAQVELLSSWEKTGDPTTYAWDNHACTKATCEKPEGAYLDRCNGHVGPNGDYHCHATLAKNGPTYTGVPYILGCYRGTPSDSATATGTGATTGATTGSGMGPPMCTMPNRKMCCGDKVYDGPETAASCATDCM